MFSFMDPISSSTPDGHTSQSESQSLTRAKNHASTLQMVSPKDYSNDDHEDPVLETLFAIEAEDIPMEESVFGIAIAATVCIFGAKAPDSRLKILFSVGWLTVLVSLAMQMYLVYQLKVYVTAPTVKRVQDLYAEWENRTYVGGVFNEVAFLKLAYDDENLLKDVCQFPIAHGPFVMIILMMWLSENLIAFKADVGRATMILSLETSEECVKVTAKSGQLILHAVSLPFKVCMSLTIFVPKATIQFILFWIGCRWLIATTNFADVLLNACALAFVTQLDEIMYNVLLTDYLKTVDKCVVLPHSETTAVLELRKGLIFLLVSSFGIPFFCWLYYRKLQHVLPGYRFDIEGPCQSVESIWNGGGTFWKW